MKEKFKLALCQMKTDLDKQRNIEKASGLIQEAAKAGAELIVLPEMFNCPYDNAMFPKYAETLEEGETVKMLQAAAKSNEVFLLGGSIPEICGNKIYNTSLMFDKDGKIIAKHRKVHLFDINIPGRMVFKESEILEAGSEITVVDTELCKIGIAICYDIRFPEQFRLMALKGAKLIIVPGAFNMVTGPAHWEALIRIRAIDNQLYVAAVSPARDTDSSYIAYANSMISDPWGNVVATAGETENIAYGNINLDVVEKVRTELPLLKNRRNDIYELKEK